MGKHLHTGTLIKGLRVIRCLAVGGEGAAYLAENRLGDLVVLKQLALGVSAPGNEVEKERFHRRAELKGVRHPNVCELLDVFVHEDLYYEVLAYVPGTNIEDVLKNDGPLPLETIVAIVPGILSGLAMLHGLGIVHRDVKPGNLILQWEGGKSPDAVLIDHSTGLRIDMPRLTCRTLGAGTYAYAPLEVIFRKGSEIDGRADLYSLGATIFEVLTGRLPYGELEGEDLVRNMLLPERPSIRAIDPALPGPLDGFVKRLMALKPEDRPDSARGALAEFQHVCDLLGLCPEPAALAVAAHPAAHPAVRGAARAALPPRLRPTRLEISSGPLAGTSIDVPRGGITLGRTLLNPEDDLISRFHLRAVRRRHRIVLTDLGSSNGLVKHKHRLRRIALLPGEDVKVGATVLRCS